MVVVSATVAGVAAVAAAVVLAGDAAVVLAVVAAVVVAAVVAVVATVAAETRSADAADDDDVPLDAPAAMHPVSSAAVATPAAPVMRRARRAGCGRRLRGGRAATRVAGL